MRPPKTLLILFALLTLAGIAPQTYGRFYLASQGRFMTRDPLGYVDGANLYEYVRSNPVYGVDPQGTAVCQGVPCPTPLIGCTIIKVSCTSSLFEIKINEPCDEFDFPCFLAAVDIDPCPPARSSDNCFGFSCYCSGASLVSTSTVSSQIISYFDCGSCEGFVTFNKWVTTKTYTGGTCNNAVITRVSGAGSVGYFDPNQILE